MLLCPFYGGTPDCRHPPAPPPLAISRVFNRLPPPRSGSVGSCYKNARFVTSGLDVDPLAELARTINEPEPQLNPPSSAASEHGDVAEAPAPLGTMSSSRHISTCPAF